jgi:hypothetical protein
MQLSTDDIQYPGARIAWQRFGEAEQQINDQSSSLVKTSTSTWNFNAVLSNLRTVEIILKQK